MDWLKCLYVLVCVWVSYLSYHLGLCIYNIFFHPLRRFPGPILGAATQLANVYYILRGVNCKYLCALHEKYGDVVRTGPNELSFRSVSAINTIYGGKPAPAETFHKNAIANLQETKDCNNVFFATGERHAWYRKLLVPAFSESTIRAQEPMIRGYCNQLVLRLHDASKLEKIVDMVPWTNFIISDILSHMLFGSGLACVEKAKYHPWVAAGFQALIESTYIEAAHRLWPYHRLCEYIFIPNSLKQGYRVHLATSQQKIEERATAKTLYLFDLLSFVIEDLGRDEILDNVNVIATAAGETTSSTLSSALYYLTHNLAAYDRVVTEIRGAFATADDINSLSSASLPYLRAALRETFHIHPTIPVGLHRITPKGGKLIDGGWVPGGTWVSVANLAVCRTSSYWENPERFVPERWLGDPEFESDERKISSPYSTGMRNCIGMGHANTQLRIILCHLLLNFDFEAQPDNAEPNDFLEYGTWQVESLNLRVKDVRCEEK